MSLIEERAARNIKIAKLHAQGIGNAVIGQRLGVSTSRVNKILIEMGARTKAAPVVKIQARGI